MVFPSSDRSTSAPVEGNEPCLGEKALSRRAVFRPPAEAPPHPTEGLLEKSGPILTDRIAFRLGALSPLLSPVVKLAFLKEAMSK